MAEPKRSRRRAPPRPEPPKDSTGDALCYCGRPRMPGSEYCAAHTVHDFLSDGSRRAAKRGKTWEALLYGLGAAVTDNIHRHDLGTKAYMLYQMRQAQKAAQPPKPAKGDPFVTLRLDPKTATVEDVRRVQRKLAEVYHSDAGVTGVVGDAMAEVNAAAEAAIKAIERRNGKL